MTREDIIAMARKSGFLIDGVQEFVFAPSSFHFTDELTAFAALVAAAERKRFAWTQEHWTEYERNIAAAERERIITANAPEIEKVNAHIKALEDAVAAEREACAKKTEEFARKWWKIHCDSNLHYSSTLKAHQDFCALQAAIRARSNT